MLESLKSLTTAKRPIVTSTPVGDTHEQPLSQPLSEQPHPLLQLPQPQPQPQPHPQPQLQGYLRAAARFIALPSIDTKGPFVVMPL